MKNRKILAAVIAGAVLVAIGLWRISERNHVRFDPVAWRNGADARFTKNAPRLHMADRLVRSRTLLGKSRHEVEVMLGPPTRTGKFREYDLVYWLGAERGFVSIDSEWLVVRFGENDRVREVKIVTD